MVATKTREKILNKIEELGYVYNRGAAGLSTGQTRIIGLAVHDITNPYFSEVCAAIESVLSQNDRMSFLCNTNESLERQRRFFKTLVEHSADGMILCPAAGTDMDLVVSADMNLSTDGMTYLALHCQRNEVTLLENPMALRHLPEQGEARKEFSQPLGFGGDYHVVEDFVQGIKIQAGTVLVPDAGRVGGVTMLARTADLAKDAKLEVAPVVQGGPFSLLAVARSLSGRDEVLWVTSPYQDEWLKEDGVFKRPLRMAQGSLVAEACEIDETKFQVKRIAELKTKSQEK